MHRVGIIGLGGISKTHAEAVRSIENAELVRCFHPKSVKAEAFAQKWGCKAYCDIDAFFSDEGMDEVIIATPSGLHLDYAIKAMEAGHDVLIEKPLDITTDRVDQLIRTSQRCGRRCGCIFQNRFSDAAETVKKAIDEGRLGRMVMADAYLKWNRSQEYYDSNGWRGTKEIDGGGALMNQGIHAVDLLLYFAGGVSEIAAFTDTLSHERIEVEDVAAASLRFSNGAVGVIEATTSSFKPEGRRIELRGTDGIIVLEDEYITTWLFREEREGDAAIRERFAKKDVISTASTLDDSLNHERNIRAFLENTDKYITAEEARKPVELITAAYNSSLLGKVIKISGK